MSISIAQYFVKKKRTLDPGQTLVLDQIESSKFKSLEYQVTAERASDNGVKSFKLSVGKGDVDYREQVYAIRGQKVRIGFITQTSGPNYELVFTNNEASEVEVTFLRSNL